MSKKTDILVLGGGPSGIISAITAKRYYPEKNVVLIKDVNKGAIPCGIPYMFASLKNPNENTLPDTALEKNKIQIVIDQAESIDRALKQVICKSKEKYSYEKLVIAVGSSPLIPPIAGIEKQGVYPIYKDMDYLNQVVEKIKNSKNVLIVGGGFIGAEIADEISKISGVKVSLVEMAERLLNNSFDRDFSLLVEERLKSNGVDIFTNTVVKEINGKDKVEKVSFANGQEIVCDGVILGVGAEPNTQMAIQSGISLGLGKGIWVDEYMRTVDRDVYAVGDCAGKRDFYTRRTAPVMLASTATAEARIAGANLYALKVVRENKGTIAIYSTYIDGLVLGSAGLTEQSAKKEGFEIVTGSAVGMDKHPGTLADGSKVKVKLIFSRKSGIILGGQVSGGVSCGEMINIIGLAIQKRVSCTELETLQMATHPHLTSSPTVYPIVLAAEDAAGKI